MSSKIICFFLAAGVFAWVYNKISRSTGGNTTNSVIVAGVAAIFAFVLMMIALSMAPGN